MSYGEFAQTYDRLMDKTLYDKWANFVTKNIPLGKIVLEMACGSGELAMRLEKQYDYRAFDLSNAMLTLAKEKVKQTALFEMDMLTFSSDVLVDGVVCFADSLCYLDNEHELQKTFQNVYDTLKNGGVFLFDVHSTYQMTHGYSNYQFQYVDDETVFVWESFEGEEPYSVVHAITCLNATKDGMYERYDEVHFERTYSLETYYQLLENIGFSNITISAEFGEQEISDTTTRWLFKADKM